MAPSKLGYWNLRGLGQPIRLLLEYTGSEYEDKRYTCGPAPTYDKTGWLEEKPNLGLDFPNLPYYFDGNVKLTQTHAIMRYIARKHGLEGKTEEEKRAVDLIENQLADFRGAFVRLCYGPNFAQNREIYEKDLPNKLKEFSDYLGTKPWFAGEKLTFVDFLVYEMLAQHKLFKEGCLSTFDNLTKFTERVEALPKIKEYIASDRFIARPCNNLMASWK